MRFLIIDDNPYDRELIIRKLRQEFRDADCVEISRQAEFAQALSQGGFDVVLTDYALKWTSGLDLLTELRARFPDLPIVMVTDTGNEEIAVEGMKAGLSDYVLKMHLQRLPYAVMESLQKVMLQKERKELEEQVRHAQKMESLGLLVGGIAHEFNNLLTGISGYAQLGLSQIRPDNSLYRLLSHIREIAGRATTMTHQLLAFSRKQTLASHNVNVNQVITHLLDFLGKVIPENIYLEFVPDENLKCIAGDSIQIEQVIMNLCINARDALPHGGKIVLKTQNSQVDRKNAEKAGVQPGAFVLLSITDTGMGMDEQTRARVFEPFFTTKEPGKGTGLGLPVVHGIVAQHRGFVTIESQVGRGTTFNIFFPCAAPTPVQAETGATHGIQEGTETILLVEDDPDVSMLMTEVLQSYGYTVITANDGAEGLELFKQHAATIALVIADLMMPRMKGRELYDAIRCMYPSTKFLFVSGFSANQFAQGIVQEEGVQFLQKPFDLDHLATTIRRSLTEDETQRSG